jgi:hypothetical protein
MFCHALTIVRFARKVISKLRYLPWVYRLLDCIHLLHTNLFAALCKTNSGGLIMNSIIKAVAIAVVLSAPVASFAQSNQPVTRAEVRSQLIQLEKAGYNLQAAEARVAAENGSTSGVGGVVSGSSESGAAAVSTFTGQRSIYAGH